MTPTSPIARAITELERQVIRRHVADLQKRGALVVSGSTANRRIALAVSPAKEAVHR